MTKSPVENRFCLDGRVALVTGSSRGLGKGIALELARAGAKVAINYSNSQAEAEQALSEVNDIGRNCCAVQADVTKQLEVEKLCCSVAEQLGPIDILVCNATCDQPELPFEQYSVDFFQKMFDYFVASPTHLLRCCLPNMKEQHFGRIVQVTSEVFSLGAGDFSAYVAAKGGQIGLSRSLARELAPYGITLNMVSPGWIPTARHSSVPQEVKDEYLTRIPVGRWGTAEDVGKAVVFFSSSEASFVTGQSLAINGGNTVAG